MKKYTIEETKKWLDHYDPIFSGPKDIIKDLETYGERIIDEMNGYTPDIHVESENKFVKDDSSPFCDCKGETEGLMERDIPY